VLDMSSRAQVAVILAWFWAFAACSGDDAAPGRPRGAGGAGGTGGTGSAAEAGQAEGGGPDGTGGRASGSGGASEQAGQGQGASEQSGGSAGTGSGANGSGGSGAAGKGGNPALTEQVVRLLIEPGGVLLTPDEPSQRLSVVALDADGNELDAAVEWTTNDPDSVSVDADGVVRAEHPAASALISVTAGSAKATVFALAATPVAGAVVVADADISAGPFADDSSAPFTPGYRYSIELAVPPPAVGKILLASGSKPVAGRVVDVVGPSVMLELVTLEEVFAELELEETLKLADAPDTTIASPVAPFNVGPFECEADFGAAELELAKNSRRLTGLGSLEYEVIWKDDRRKIEVRGKPGLEFELEPTLSAALSGSVTCKVTVKEFVIPLPGPLGIFLGAAVVLGAGVELGGEVPIAGVGVNLKGHASADFAMGATCVDGDCSTRREIETESEVTPTLVFPEVSLKFEPEAQAFVYAELEGGARFTSTLRAEAIEARAGFKLAGSFASEETQVEDEDYASKYELSFEAEIGPGEAVDDFFELIGFALSFLKFEKSIPLAGSPTGTVNATAEEFVVGDDVTFNVLLEPSTVVLPLVGYNVEKIRIYRRETRPDGSVSLILANEKVAEPAQTSFSIPWVATVDGTVENNFVAFVSTELVSPPLELGSATPGSRSGSFTFFSGETLVATDGYVVDFPPGTPGNPVDGTVRLGRVYYGVAPDAFLVCTKEQFFGGVGFMSLLIADVDELAPGTYFYSDWDAAGGVQPGTFMLSLSTQQACIPTDLGPVCECAVSDIANVFTTGELVLASGEGLLDGTFSVVVPGYGTSSGSFSVPFCPKSLDDHARIHDERIDCVPPPAAP
jgi:hypothetical protein